MAELHTYAVSDIYSELKSEIDTKFNKVWKVIKKHKWQSKSGTKTCKKNNSRWNVW